MTGQTIVCVAAVVRDGDRILLVRQAAGHSLEGQWTVPWGRLEAGESPSAAALREALEEAGIAAEIEGMLGVQELPAPWDGWIALVYLCRYVSGTPAPDHFETDAARFFLSADFAALTDPVEPWSRWLAGRIFDGRFQSIAIDSSGPFRAPSFL